MADFFSLPKVIWALLAVLGALEIFQPFPGALTLGVIVALMVATAGAHACMRYGARHALAFFLIACGVSLVAETMSIRSGAPFGNYQYVNLIGPRIFEVPLTVILSWFAMAYVSWTVAHIVTRQYRRRLEGLATYILPVTASFIMVMWDLVTDPAAVAGQLWVWTSGGSYFGVPLSNFIGWALVSYVIFQTFAFYIARFDTHTRANEPLGAERFIWLQMVVLYALQAAPVFSRSMTASADPAMHRSLALIAFFTMVFVIFLTVRELWSGKPE